MCIDNSQCFLNNNKEGERMLISFKVKNVLSFKELTEFSMVAGSTIKNDERLTNCKDFKLLKFSSIFGANASGKSNLVYAFKAMKNIVILSMPNFSVDYYYKLQDINKMESSYFEAILYLDNKSYSYGFEVSFVTNKIISEWLYELKGEHEKLIFENDVLNNKITFKKNFDAKLLNKLEFYKIDFVNNQTTLLLKFLNTDKPSLFEFEEAKIFKLVYNWFVNSLDIANPTTMITSAEFFKVESRLNCLSKFMEMFDTGIHKIDKVKKSIEEVKKELPTRIIDSIREAALKKMQDKNNYNDIGSFIRIDNKFWIIKISKNGEMEFEQIYFYHDMENKYPLTLEEESEGTARILDLAEILLTDGTNKTYVVDELDRCLHPQLTCKFVKLFLEKAKNENNNNQLIVTTHESRLLDFDILRRDEIWFVEKKNNISSLYSLEEYNVRFDKKIDKAYLEGRYGGIPVFDKVFPNVMTENEISN